MNAIKHELEVKAIQLSGQHLKRAIENTQNFKGLEDCFEYFRSELFWWTLEDYGCEDLGNTACLLFIESFNDQFETNFGEQKVKLALIVLIVPPIVGGIVLGLFIDSLIWGPL